MKKMKYFAAIFLAVGLLAGCGKKQVVQEPETNTVKSDVIENVVEEVEIHSEVLDELDKYSGKDPYEGTISECEETLYIYDSISKEEAEEDLTYFYRLLKQRHPAWLDGSDDITSQIDAIYKDAMANFSAQVLVLDLYKSASRMASILKDAHTNCFIYGSDYFINSIKQVNEYGIPTRIDDIDIDTLFKRALEVKAYELEEYCRFKLEHSYIFYPEELELLGIDTSDGVEYTFENGNTILFEVGSLNQYLQERQKDNNQEYKWVDYEIDTEHNLGIFRLKECICNDEYISTVNEFFDAIKENHIENIVIDLQGNEGGNSYVADEFIKHLNVTSYSSGQREVRIGDKLEYYDGENIIWIPGKDFEGDIYVLTNTLTFSAATDFAMMIKDNGLGEIIGTTSGNKPHCYIDCLMFQMPNSKIGLSISYKIRHRVDIDKDEEDLTPDYVVTDKAEVMNKVYELIADN